MNNEPCVWHYGLMAERWGEFLHEAPELPYFQGAIGRFGRPVLDLGCGAGRLLLPLLQSGVAIEGCDISGDMLAQLRRRAAALDLAPTLYEQPMHLLDLPRRYRTIYICDSFGLSGGRANDLQALRRCYEHLRPGGALLLNIQAEYTEGEAWQQWLPEGRAALPQPWPAEGARRVSAAGAESIGYFRVIDVDPLEQTYRREVRLEKWQDGRLLAAESYELQGDMYLKNEVLLMLQVAGFSDITLQGDYTARPATADSQEINFVAVK